MGKSVKRTKKFVKKHLKSTLAHRRKLKPIKKALKRKQKTSSADYSHDLAGSRLNEKNESAGKKLVTRNITEMNVDEFLDGDFFNVGSGDDNSISSDDTDHDLDDYIRENESDGAFIDITPADLEEDDSSGDDEGGDSNLRSQNKSLLSEVEKHKRQLEKLKEKDPEFFKFLEEHDKELLEFSDEEELSADDAKEPFSLPQNKNKDLSQVDADASSSRLTIGLVESWCKIIKEKNHMGTVCNLLKAYRTACHYGDGDDQALANNFNIASSHVFNKIMFFTLSEMDGIIRRALGMDGKAGSVFEPDKFPRWKKLEPLVRSYVGNTLHILTQMTDNQMITFTLKRLKESACFLGALPKFAHKYLKVVLHFWGRGEGSVSLVSFLFIREMALLLGTDHLDACLKGMYKEYAANSKFVTASSLPRIRFMANCVVELYGVDFAASYQQAFVFIRQLAIILRNALTMKTKEAFKQVYSWQYVNCLEVWVRVLSTYADRKDLQPLGYPLTQILTGVAQLVPTARYFPLRIHCVQLLNLLAAAMGIYIPVASLLLDMLEFKELNKPPTGGVGKAIDFGCTLKVSKPTLKTRAFQDECVTTVVDQISEHLVQWSYSVAFPELVQVPLLGLRRFVKATKVGRFQTQVKQLLNQIEENISYVGRKRDNISFCPKDSQMVTSFLKEEKIANASPLSKFCASLRQSAMQRRSNMQTSSVLVKEEIHKNHADKRSDSDEEDALENGANAFNSDWLPPKKVRRQPIDEEKTKKKRSRTEDAKGGYGEDSDAEDVVEDFELSSEDDSGLNEMDHVPSSDEDQSAGPQQNGIKGKNTMTKEKKKRGNAGLRNRKSAKTRKKWKKAK
ncbi:hypothetical protein KP509_04G069800 [Ceratopteris richardii]|uniref:Nucleolar complex protein 2 homolog n=1 Tax=Ceratopteris richardii TaxID=49495 RepID=A0A8T2V1I4_CERRI|nr:hypothetical protein KP509_04G069800 [Ceratopteris richardii]